MAAAHGSWCRPWERVRLPQRDRVGLARAPSGVPPSPPPSLRPTHSPAVVLELVLTAGRRRLGSLRRRRRLHRQTNRRYLQTSLQAPAHQAWGVEYDSAVS